VVPPGTNRCSHTLRPAPASREQLELLHSLKHHQRLNEGALVSQLLLIPLEEMVVFPNMSVTLTVDVAEGERVLLVPVHDGAYADVGTVAEATNVVRLPGGAWAATLNGLH